MHPIELPPSSVDPESGILAMAQTIADRIARLRGESIYLVGYSMGGIIAFEVARALHRIGVDTIRKLVILGTAAPQCSRRWLDDCATDESSLVQFMRTNNGISAEELQSPEFASIVAAALRRDLLLLKAYRFEPEFRLRCPICAIGAEHDMIAPPRNLIGWRWHTRSSMRLGFVPGDHSFVRRGTDDVLLQISAMITSEGE